MVFMATQVPSDSDPLQLLLEDSVSSLQRPQQPSQAETNPPQRNPDIIAGEHVEDVSDDGSSPGELEASNSRRKVSFGGVVNVSHGGPRTEDDAAEGDGLFASPFSLIPGSSAGSQMSGSSGSSIKERRKSNRGSFELDETSQSWVTPKATPSLSIAAEGIGHMHAVQQSGKLKDKSSSFEDLKKSLRMTPLAKKDESVKTASDRVSSLQRPRRPSQAEIEQQQRKDSGGSVETRTFVENRPPFHFTISSLGSGSSHGLPRSPPPRAKHRRSDAVMLSAQEQLKCM